MTDFKKKTGQKLVSADQEFLPPWNNNGIPKRLLTTDTLTSKINGKLYSWFAVT